MNERIEAVVRAWPQWSRAERCKMPQLVEEILSHCRDGTGNPFVRRWCDRNLSHLFIAAVPGTDPA